MAVYPTPPRIMAGYPWPDKRAQPRTPLGPQSPLARRRTLAPPTAVPRPAPVPSPPCAAAPAAPAPPAARCPAPRPPRAPLVVGVAVPGTPPALAALEGALPSAPSLRRHWWSPGLVPPSSGRQ
ncbi:oleosin-B6-like [Sorghum bicolor]|uniref:oleosin-B6-like n=1 Tax=Sorghum bicolor TaxID=4558 RepID=UPI000B425EAD|nr:oleosin-B6-like [Sorghum bicolor]|eukprot:XP_021317857.1 oleosin-B6-like [Sorghum bicolor]